MRRYPEHTLQFLTHKPKNFKFEKSLLNMLIMRVRNWWVHWACASGTYACTERTSVDIGTVSSWSPINFLVRGLSCKNKGCDMVFKEAADRRKLAGDACKLCTGTLARPIITVWGGGGGGQHFSLFASRLRKNLLGHFYKSKVKSCNFVRVFA